MKNAMSLEWVVSRADFERFQSLLNNADMKFSAGMRYFSKCMELKEEFKIGKDEFVSFYALSPWVEQTRELSRYYFQNGKEYNAIFIHIFLNFGNKFKLQNVQKFKKELNLL